MIKTCWQIYKNNCCFQLFSEFIQTCICCCGFKYYVYKTRENGSLDLKVLKRNIHKIKKYWKTNKPHQAGEKKWIEMETIVRKRIGYGNAIWIWNMDMKTHMVMRQLGESRGAIFILFYFIFLIFLSLCCYFQY